MNAALCAGTVGIGIAEDVSSGCWRCVEVRLSTDVKTTWRRAVLKYNAKLTQIAVDRAAQHLTRTAVVRDGRIDLRVELARLFRIGSRIHNVRVICGYVGR